jgi:hypothetical protein
MSRSVLMALVLATAAAADEVAIAPSRDNTLYEVDEDDDEVSNGAGDFFFAGLTDGNQSRRGLMAFDVAGAIPTGATITSVVLELTMSKTITGDKEIRLHRVLADWGEGASDAPGEEGGGIEAQPGDATWVHTFFDVSLWAAEGGDFDAAPSASATVGDTGEYAWGSTDGMVADVQGWLDQPATNFGWMVLGPEDGTSAKRFNTRENADPQTRPMLRVQFDPAPCAADCDGTGNLDLFDFLCFINFFGQEDPAADCDQDNDYSLFDFLCFLNAFNQGC